MITLHLARSKDAIYYKLSGHMERGIWKMEFGRWNLKQGICETKSPDRGFRYTNPQKIGVLNQKKIFSKI